MFRPEENGPNQDTPNVRFHVDWWEGNINCLQWQAKRVCKTTPTNQVVDMLKTFPEHLFACFAFAPGFLVDSPGSISFSQGSTLGVWVPFGLPLKPKGITPIAFLREASR